MGILARGEAAYQLGDLYEAKQWLERATNAPGGRSTRAMLRLGQIAVTTGDLVDGYHRLAALTKGSDPIAEEARASFEPVADEAGRQIAARRQQRGLRGRPA